MRITRTRARVPIVRRASSAVSTVQALRRMRVVDSWGDTVRGIGTHDKSGIQFTGHQLDYDSLSDLVDYDWLARRVVRKLPDAAWQQNIQFAEPADQKHWDRINTVRGNDDGAFLSAAIWARTHGASLLIKGYGFDGALETPLPENPGPIEFLEPVRAADYSVQLNTDSSDPVNFGLPEFYLIEGDHRLQGNLIHRSRVTHFAGMSASKPENMRDEDALVGLSALDPVHDVIVSEGLTWESISNMMQQASIPIWKMKGLINGLASNPDEVFARFALMTETLSSSKAAVVDVDAGEDYRRESASFADIPQILQQQALRVAASADIPATKLYGRIISGLGEASDSEEVEWNSRISTYRTTSLEPRIVEIVGEDTEWSFLPLSVPTPLEHVDEVQKWWTMGGINEKEIQKLAHDALTLPEPDPEEAPAPPRDPGETEPEEGVGEPDDGQETEAET